MGDVESVTELLLLPLASSSKHGRKRPEAMQSRAKFSQHRPGLQDHPRSLSGADQHT